MKKCFGKRFLGVFLALLFFNLASSDVHAQAVVTDTQSTGRTVKQWFTEVQESKTVVATMQTVQKTSSAIGTAKKTVSEYVIKNKEKIEEKLAKIQEYKEKAEKYKAEYEKYKKQLDENIAKAKELKEQAEAGIEAAKETAEAAKEAAGSAVDAAKDKVGGAVDAAKDKAGISSDTEQAEEMAKDASTDETSTEEGAKATDAAVETPTNNAATEPAAGADGKTAAEGNNAADSTPTSSRTAFSGAESQNANTLKEGSSSNMDLSSVLSTEELSTFNSLSNKKTLSAEENAKLNVLKSKISEAQSLKATDTNTSSANISKAVVGAPAGTEVKAIEETTTNAIAKPAVTKPAVTTPTERTQLRKAFTTSSLHQSETLMFAKVELLNLPDGGTDSNETVIIPRALAMYCGINSGDALEAGKVDDCLLRLNKERQSAQLFSGSDAPRVYNQAMAQYVAASMAEAYKARQDADSFEENFIDAVDFASEPTAQDVYDNIVELNKAVDMQMNGLLKVFSTQLAVQSLYNYGSYSFVPEEGEEND